MDFAGKDLVQNLHNIHIAVDISKADLIYEKNRNNFAIKSELYHFTAPKDKVASNQFCFHKNVIPRASELRSSRE